MSENLISKKDLLEQMDISYGQLYRWKRKKLIPEDWFIKKSSYTGQETFFPKEEILARIDKILNMKDGLSLDEIANMFTPDLGDMCFTESEIKDKNILNEITMKIYKDVQDENETFTLEQVLCMYVIEKFMKSGKVSMEEGKMLMKEIFEKYSKLSNKNYDIILFRKFGVGLVFFIENQSEYFVDGESVTVHKENINKNSEELKLKISPKAFGEL